MNVYLPQWSGVGLIDVTLKALLIVVLAACIAAFLRKAAASTRHAVWLAAVVVLITLPIAAVMLPQLSLPLLPANPMDMPASTALDIAAWSWPDVAQEVSSDGLAYGSMFAGIWATGVFLLIVRAAVGLIRLDRLRRGAEAVNDPMWQAAVDVARQQTGMCCDVRLLMSPRVRTPIIWGLWRIYVCLPMHADEWNASNRRMVLAHELTHVRRGDWLWQMLVIAMTAVHWFNPLAWWAAHRLRMEAEIACDDAMLEQGFTPSGYADCLYRIVRAAKAAPLHLNPAMPMARPSELPVRMARILSDKTRRRQTRFQTLMWTLVLSTLLGSVVAAARVGRAQPAVDDRQTNERELPPDLNYEEAVILIEDALEEGRITREQARERLEGLRQRRWNENGIAREQADPRQARFSQVREEIIKDVREGRLTRAQAAQKLEALRRAIWRDETDDLPAYSDETVREAVRRSVRAGDVSRGELRQYIDVLTGNGIKREQIEPVLDVILELAHEMKSDPTDVEIEPRLRDHLRRFRLTDEQIRLVQGLAWRIAVSKRQDDRAPSGRPDRNNGADRR